MDSLSCTSYNLYGSNIKTLQRRTKNKKPCGKGNNQSMDNTKIEIKKEKPLALLWIFANAQ